MVERRGEEEEHVATHEQYIQQKQLSQFLAMVPGDGSEAGGPPAGGDSMEVPIMGPGASMAPNGAVPDMSPEQGV